MLRHYDAHGVLLPAATDPQTGYRHYAKQQLRDAADIRNLRDIGFGVSAISALLAARGTPAWSSALELQRQALADELNAAQARLALITRMLDKGDPSMTITIERTTAPAMTIVALRGTVPTYADEGQLWEKMMPSIEQQGIKPIGPFGVIEHDDEYTEHDVDLSIFLPVAPGTSAASPLEVIELPARDCLIARVIGPYDQIPAAHELISERLVSEGLSRRSDGTLAAKVFNRYLATHQEVTPDKFVTEVCVPITS